MKLRRRTAEGRAQIEVATPAGWMPVRNLLSQVAPDRSPGDLESLSSDLVALLGASGDLRHALAQAASSSEPTGDKAGEVILPFEPRSFRDFMLYERHAIDAARGYVRNFMPGVLPIVRSYEKLTGRDFPLFKPKPLWHRQPIYYFGNHLNIATDGAKVARPAYTRALDYELELGFVLARPLLNASPTQAEGAIGGFVVLNDFSARDVQRPEMQSGFGPQKAKHFASAISSTLVTADEILPRWKALKGHVKINGRLVAEPMSENPRWSLGEALAHASRSERLHPGELFATGTWPGGSGMETGHLLEPGDVIELGIEGLGTLSNTIVTEQDARP